MLNYIVIEPDHWVLVVRREVGENVSVTFWKFGWRLSGGKQKC